MTDFEVATVTYRKWGFNGTRRLEGRFRMSPEFDDDDEIIGFIENSKIFPDEARTRP